MPSQKDKTQSENPVFQKKTVPPPSPEQLSKMACLLSKNESDEPKALVKRALEIWRVANEELSGTKPYQDGDQIPFDKVGAMKNLPAIRAGYEIIESGKGVGKAVDRYFEALLDEYDHVMQERQIDTQTQKAIKHKIEQLRKNILTRKEIPKRVLDLLKQFQINMRQQSHQFSAPEIRELLGGVDVGTPSSDL